MAARGNDGGNDAVGAARRVVAQPGVVRELLHREHSSALHPLSGVAMLGLDWLLFGGELLSGFVLEPLLAPLGALAGFAATFMIERRYAGRPLGRSVLAALFGALVVGLPWPISGTFVGMIVLALSGLRRR
jgi:hypothetical protein